MRIAAWVFAVCLSVCGLGVFLPAAELDVGEQLATERSAISLYGLSQSKSTVRAFLHEYRASTTRKIGAAVLGKVTPYMKGQARADADDVQEAMAALDTIRDEDIETVGRIMAATMWSLCGLAAASAALLFGVTVATSRLRLAAAVVAALCTAAVAVAVHVALRQVAAEANAELELELFSLRVGAYLIPLGALGALAATIGVVVGHTRERRRFTAPLRP